MQITVEAATIAEMSYRLNELSAIFSSGAHVPTMASARKEMPISLQQALVDSTPIPQVETKTVKKEKLILKKQDSEGIVEAAQTPPTSKRGKVITKEDLQGLVQQLVNKKTLAKARVFLSSIGVDVLRNLPEEKYSGVYDALKMELQN